MDTKTAIFNRRTIRRFSQKPIEEELMRQLVDLSRMYASGANLQPIRFAAVMDDEKKTAIFETLRWAAYLPDFEITKDQRPTAYMVLTADTQIKKNCQFDLGAAATTFMIAAESCGLGTCCLASFSREKLIEILDLPEDREPLLVIAVGYPDQLSRAVDFSGDVKYYEDESGCLCVPKRTLDQVLTVY